MENQITNLKKWLGTGSINIFGPQFSGKDTQCLVLAEIFNGVKLSSGEILRSHKEASDALKEMNKGNLAPTDSFRDIVLPYLANDDFSNKPLLLSSVGRMHGEEEAVLKACSDANHPIKAVIELEIPDKEIEERFQKSKLQKDRGKREDDSLESLMQRLKLYRENTSKVLDFYNSKELLIKVDGLASKEEVTKRIIEKLFEYSTKT